MPCGSEGQLTPTNSAAASSRCCNPGKQKGRIEKMKEKLGKLRQSVRQSMATGITWAWAHKLRIAVLAIVFALIAPRPAKTQFLDPCLVADFGNAAQIAFFGGQQILQPRQALVNQHVGLLSRNTRNG